MDDLECSIPFPNGILTFRRLHVVTVHGDGANDFQPDVRNADGAHTTVVRLGDTHKSGRAKHIKQQLRVLLRGKVV